MAESEEKSRSFRSSEERYKYIGFEVFPGKPGNIFSSDEERKSLIEKVMRKLTRSEGEVRDRCTLMGERVSHAEKILLTVAAVVLVISLFLPWFSGYHEIVTTTYVAVQSDTREVMQEATEGAVSDSPEQTAAAGSETEVGAVTETPADVVANAETSQAEMASTETAAATDEGTGESIGEEETASTGEETSSVPENMRAVIEIDREFKSISGIGALASIGSYGSMVFSSGFVLAVSGILMIIFILSCIVLAALNLYLLYGVKKTNPDEQVLYWKKMLKLNWIPILIFFVLFFLSFVGADYGFNSEGMIKQVGDSYTVMTFIDMTFGQMSFGFIMAFMSFWVLALKGKEI